jgi:serine/threonine-protein kinase
MGAVYRARDERLERDVAIKVLPPKTFDDKAVQKRFRKEALALAKISHPNIATIYDVGDCDGLHFIAMLDGMASAVDKSLMQQIEQENSEPRFVMLGTIREYAREKLKESGEEVPRSVRIQRTA